MDTVRSSAMEENTSILMCPVCEGQICTDDSAKNRLVCLDCGERYPVVDGIPVMIPEQVRLVDPELVQLYSNLPARTEEDEHAPYVTEHASYIQRNANLDGKVVVDLGGAEGMLCSRLAGMVKVIIADISLPRLRQGASRRATDTTFVCGDLQTPFLNLQADVVLLMSVLEHVPSPDDVILNVKRILGPGGVLIVYVPICNFPLSRLAVWLFRKIKRIDIDEARKQHLRVYSTESLRAQIVAVGLSIEDLRHTSVFGEFKATKRLSAGVGKKSMLNGLLASGLYLLARKP